LNFELFCQTIKLLKMITGTESVNPFFRFNENGYGESVVLNFPDGSKQFLPYETGINLRQHFAAKAMQGFMSNPTEAEISSTYVIEFLGLDKETKYSFKDHYPKYVAKISVAYADALIAELNVKAPNSRVLE
jgi:hypothetical protein